LGASKGLLNNVKLVRRNELEPDNRANQQENEENAPKRGWFVKNEDSDDYGAYGADAGPDRVARAHGNGLGGFVQEDKAQDNAHKKGCRPALMREIVGKFQAGSEGYFKQTCDNEVNPSHGFLNFGLR
jgi:hypothetical protein